MSPYNLSVPVLVISHVVEFDDAVWYNVVNS